MRSRHELRGAVFRPEAGWSVPAGYTSVDAEVRDVRSRAGIIDWSDRAKIELTGTERVPFLDGLVTADVKVLGPNTSAYALLLNEKSRVLGDLRVFAFPDSLLLDVEMGQKEAVLRILEKARVSDDVEFRDLGAVGHLEVHGPLAGPWLAEVLGQNLLGLPTNEFLTSRTERWGTVHAGRVPSMTGTAYAVWSPASDLAEVWDRMIACGATPFGRDAWEVLRIESGTPRFGADMGEDTLALEVAPEFALNFTKGCYVGQEVVARGTYVGQIRRKLQGLRMDGDVPPVRGDAVSVHGREVGAVTSGAWSPTLRSGIALALLRLDAGSGGNGFVVDRSGQSLRAKLSPLPFVA